jgi:hypothetical protein
MREIMSCLKSASLAVLILSVAACQKPSEPEGTGKSGVIQNVAAQSSTQMQQPITGKGKNNILTVTPAEMTACDPAAVAKFSYDLAQSNPDTKGVSVFVQAADADSPKLFGQTGRSFSGETGPWVRPGMKISIEDSDSHSELDTIVISGPKCN